MKQICKRGHDTLVLGRDAHGCIQCKKEYRPSDLTKERCRISSLNWHKRNPERTRAAFKRHHHKNKQERIDFLTKFKNRPCADCQDWFEPCQMDFDHRDPSLKVDSISKMGWNSQSLLKIKQEIQKCDLVCANCHRLRTRKQYAN